MTEILGYRENSLVRTETRAERSSKARQSQSEE
jgi:hypothetical protein